jgi:surface-anchored protein
MRITHLKRFAILLFLGSALCAPGFEGFGYRSYTAGHADIGIRLVEGQLVGYWKNDAITVDGKETSPDSDYAAGEIRALGIFDAATPPLKRPAPAQWDFLGVEAGEPIYILPAGGVPNTVPYLGFTTEDPSLPSLGASAYRFTLVDMTGPVDGVFSLFTSASAKPMNTMHGFPAGSITMSSGNHEHYNWAFSHPGTYDLYFEFEALSGNTVITNGSDMFRFQITDGGGFDSYDHWRRTVFTPEQIADDAVSGPSASPFADGVSNVQRFAYGNNPSVQFIWITDNDHMIPGVDAYLRQDSGLNTMAEFATELAPPNWANTGLHLLQSERIFHDPGMERRQYRIQHPDVPRGYFRLRADLPLP